MEAFLVEALAAPASPASLAGLKERLAAMWRLPWENEHKVPFKRLVLNGFRIYGSDRLPPAQQCQCPCGRGVPGRWHCFHACPVARAVWRSVAVASGAFSGAGAMAPPLALRHAWLAEPPPGVAPGVWLVVVLAAVEALDKGRRCLLALWLAARDADVAADRAPDAVRARVVRASAVAVESFWALLGDFAALNSARLPRGWQCEQLPPAAPFLHAVPGGAGGLRASARPQDASVEAVLPWALRESSSA